MIAVNHINRQHLQVRLLVAPERTLDGVIRLYLGADQVVDLPPETADELARLVTMYRRHQKAVTQ